MAYTQQDHTQNKTEFSLQLFPIKFTIFFIFSYSRNADSILQSNVQFTSLAEKVEKLIQGRLDVGISVKLEMTHNVAKNFLFNISQTSKDVAT